MATRVTAGRVLTEQRNKLVGGLTLICKASSLWRHTDFHGARIRLKSHGAIAFASRCALGGASALGSSKCLSHLQLFVMSGVFVGS